MWRAKPRVRRAALGHACLALLVLAAALGPVPARAALLLTLEAAAPALASGPFAPGNRAEGFILIGDEPSYSEAFFGQGPPLVGSAARRPVLDFRISLGAMTWTPSTGTFGILGFLDGGQRIESMVFGARRGDCGPVLAPCVLELVDLGTGGSFRLDVYRPPDGASGLSRIDLYRSSGVSFSAAAPRAAPAPSTPWLALGALVAALASCRPAVLGRRRQG